MIQMSPDLTKPRRMNKRAVENLIENGYDTLEKIAAADADLLVKYRGVGKVAVLRLRALARANGIPCTGKSFKPSFIEMERKLSEAKRKNKILNAALRQIRERGDWSGGECRQYAEIGRAHV